MISLQLRIVAVFVLLCLSAVFSASETALFSLNRRELTAYRRGQDKRSRMVIDLLRSPRKLLSTILLGNEIINVGIAIFSASIMTTLLFNMSWEWVTVISIAVSTPLIIVFGEVFPKNIAIRNATETIDVTVGFLKFFSKAVSYPRRALGYIADRLIIVFGGDPKVYKPMMMEEEFCELLSLGFDQGTIDDAEVDLIRGVFDLGSTTIDKIMTPLSEVFRLPLSKEIDDVMKELRATQFSRIPVYEKDPNDIVGVLHSRDLLSCVKRGLTGKVADLEEVIRSAFFVKGNMTIEILMRELQRRKVHMGIVLDDKQKAIGIVTMEDVLSFIFRRGEVEDV